MIAGKFQPRTRHYAKLMDVPPSYQGETWVEGEDMNDVLGDFHRRGLVRHSKTKKLVRVWMDIPETHNSVPAYTGEETGYVTVNIETGEFEFRPRKRQPKSSRESP